MSFISSEHLQVNSPRGHIKDVKLVRNFPPVYNGKNVSLCDLSRGNLCTKRSKFQRRTLNH